MGLQGKYGDEEGYVDKGLMLDPNNSWEWGAKGNIDEFKGDKAATIFDYKKAIKLNTNNIPALKALHRLEHP